MRNGGFFMDSKKEIYDLIPAQYYPKTLLIPSQTSWESTVQLLKNAALDFPCIAKPDIGLRGSAVKKINTINDLEQYHSRANFDYLLQAFIPFPKEIGIFYVRYPYERKGRITGIVGKEFLVVEGDGVATVAQLLRLNPRYELQLEALQKEYGDQIHAVIPKGEKRNLVPYGNHARGAKFIDYSHLITPELTDVIETICSQINGFYFGRMDLMYASWEELEQGKKYAIVELNGAASEPTHIYDPSHSVFFAWKELARHLRYMYEISRINHQKGFPYLTHQEGMKQYRLHREQNKKIVNF